MVVLNYRQHAPGPVYLGRIEKRHAQIDGIMQNIVFFHMQKCVF